MVIDFDICDKIKQMHFQIKGRQADPASNPWQTITTRNVYENPWIRVEHHEVLNPSGGPGIYGFIHFKNTAIGVIPLDHEGNTWLVGQYRYALKHYSWEIPEGGGLWGVDPIDAAKRELLEETGITAACWTPLLEMHTSNSVTDEYSVAYIARDLSFGEAQPEETEQLLLKKLPFEEVVGMVLSGEITDALSMVAVLKANEWLRNGTLTY